MERIQSFVRFAKSSKEPGTPSLETQRKAWQKANPQYRIERADRERFAFDDGEVIDELNIVYSFEVSS